MAVFVADRISKGLVEANIPYGTEVNVVPGTVWLANAHNSGAAFGVLPSAALIFTVASAVVAGALVYYVFTRPGTLYRDLLLGLVLGGTLGNGYDRLVHGTVTDFVALHFWPVFNVADACISVGVAGLVLGHLLRRSSAG
jgi:signal peptidase II